jgi:hypothetical protein
MEGLDDSQRRDLLAALGDDTLSIVIAQLLESAQSQQQLSAVTGFAQPEISRALRHLRVLGVVHSPRGRGAMHELLFDAEIRALLGAVDAVISKVNRRRTRAQAALTEGGRTQPRRRRQRPTRPKA